MHEFSLCEGILKQVAKANQNNLTNVEYINIEIGKLAGVDTQSLLFWFPVVAKKLSCEHVQLAITEPEGIALCNTCAQQFEIHNLYDACPHCYTFGNYEILHGRELMVKSFTLTQQ